jgi:hypothetical protein
MTFAAAPADVVLAHRDLISEQLWQRMVARIAREENLDVSPAERVVNEALGFLKYIADHPAAALAPSPVVEIGWHTFILYARECAAHCDRYANMFIRHDPADGPDVSAEVLAPRETADLITVQLGYAVDPTMWAADAERGGCGGGGGTGSSHVPARALPKAGAGRCGGTGTGYYRADAIDSGGAVTGMPLPV